CSLLTVAIAPSIAVGGFRVTLYPCLEQSDGGEPRQSPNRVVDLAGRRATLVVAEEVSCHEQDLCARLDAAAHGRPEAVHDQPRLQPLRERLAAARPLPLAHRLPGGLQKAREREPVERFFV